MICTIGHCTRCELQEQNWYTREVCLECATPYLPTASGHLCSMCAQVLDCELCDDYLINQCGKCKDGHIISTDGQCSCQFSGSNCVKCNADHLTCFECEPGYLPTEDGLHCGKCGLTYHDCAKCRNGELRDTQCAVCQNGMRPHGYTECGVCHHVENCMYCDATYLDACAKCIEGFILIDIDGAQTCTYFGITNCLLVENGRCVRCEAGYTLGYDGYSCGTCTKTDINCLYCDELDTTKCGVCMDQYVLNYNQVCVKTEIQNNPNCLYSDGRTCTKCKKGYVPSQDGLCGTCGGLCGMCMSQPNTHKCAKCSEVATRMRQQTDGGDGVVCCPPNCLACEVKYALRCQETDGNGSCIFQQMHATTTVCTACDASTVLTPQGFCSDRCFSAKNCVLCDHLAQLCIKCAPGTIINNGRCIPCPGGLVPNINRTGCVLGSCQNITDCKFCGEAESTCEACVNGLPTQDKRKCGSCSPSCLSCDNVDAHLCFECLNSEEFPTYFGDCSSDPIPSCVKPAILVPQTQDSISWRINDNQSTKCLPCVLGFFWDPNAGCKPILNQQLNCLAWYSDGRCMRCKNGWTRSQNGTCAKVSVSTQVQFFFRSVHVVYIGFIVFIVIAIVLHCVELTRKRKAILDEKKAD